MQKHKCLCCGKETLSNKPSGTFEICSECGWEDDNIQYENPDYRGGANEISLNETRKIYLKNTNISI